MERAAVLAEQAYPPAGTILEELGLRGLKQLSFHVGFQDRLIRSTTELHMPGKREGILRLLTAEAPLDYKSLPKFPPDANSVTVSRFHLGTFYETIIDAVEVSVGTLQPDQLEEFRRNLKQVQDALGIDLEKDLFDALGSTLAVYSAPSEGPFIMGLTGVLKVNDQEKLAKTLRTLINTLPATTGADVQLSECDYQGTTVYTVRVRQQGFPFAPSYAITRDGWLVVALLPQPVQGFLYRNSGEGRGAWKAPPITGQVLGSLRSKTDARVTAIRVTDPRPGLAQLLSIAPLFTQMITSISGAGSDFDVGLIPAAQPVTERLTHNVTAVVDDGQSVRWEGYASLPLPLQITGLDMYAYVAFLPYVLFAF